MTQTYRVYLSVAPGMGGVDRLPPEHQIGPPDGGWHVTLASHFADSPADLTRRVHACMLAALGADATWHFTATNSRALPESRIAITSPALERRLLPALRRAGVGDVARPGTTLHMEVYPADSERVLDELRRTHAPMTAWVAEVDPATQGNRRWFSTHPAHRARPPRPLEPGRLTGAGVLLVEWYRRRGSASASASAREGLAVLLFRDARTGRYCDAGGFLDSRSRESAMSCAQRELREESMGLFRCDLARCETAAVLCGPSYQAFVVPVVGPPGVGIRRDHFHRNRQVALALPPAQRRLLPSDWLEVDDMTRFFLADLVRAGVATQRGDLHGARDVYGAACTIDGRAKAATREAMATGLLARCAQTGGGPAGSPWNALNMDAACGHGIGVAGTALRAATRRRTHCYWI
jgi:hypothetical protein